MTEFKQIVGRGTRVHEDTKKFYFTLIDFRGTTNHFADPDFDGEPVQIYEPGEGDPISPPDDVPPKDDDGETLPDEPTADETIVDGPPDISLPLTGGKVRKVYVDGVGATIVAERVEYLDANGRLVTESLRDFTRAALKRRFASLDDFLRRWKGAERKQAIMEELEAEGLPLDPIIEELGTVRHCRSRKPTQLHSPCGGRCINRKVTKSDRGALVFSLTSANLRLPLLTSQSLD
jgi:type I restriction enzyme R subunit